MAPYLQPMISPMLALLMFVISLTFDWSAVYKVLKKPLYLLVAAFLVFGPMAAMGWGLGRLFFQDSLLFVGQTLVGTLPTDVSAPLLILLARGSVALGAVMNALVTGLSPIVLPPLFVWLTGTTLEVPVLSLMLKLSAIILLPMIVGVTLRSRYPTVLSNYEPVYFASSVLLYLLLLFAVVAESRNEILSLGSGALILLLVQLLLNASGYLLGFLLHIWVKRRNELVTFLFTISKKEFSIAAAVVATSGLPEAVAIPGVFYAVVQMITSPIAVHLLNNYWVVRESDG